MADVDELILQVSANATNAISNLSILQNKLRNLARDIGTASSAANSMNKAFIAMNRVSNIDSSKINRVATSIVKLKNASTGVDTSGLSDMANQLKTFESIDVKSNGVASLANAIARLSGVKEFDNDSLKKLHEGVSKFAEMDNVSNGITNLVSALARLSKIDMGGFNPDTFKVIVESVTQLANMDEVSNGVNRLVNSIAKLANAGSAAKVSAENIRPLGTALREVVKGFSSSGGIPALFNKGMSGNISASVNQFVGALANLANAGDKVGITAQQLSELQAALTSFIEHMATLPEVNQNLALFVSGLGQLASSGTKAGKAGSVLNKIGDDTKKTGLNLQELGKIADKVLSKIRSVFSSIATKISSLARTIASKIGIIGESSKSLFSVSDGIKSVIGGLIGFRGLSGIFNWTKEAVSMGAAITEIDHIVENVFSENMIGYVDKWAKEAITQFGIAEHSAKQYAGVLSAMFQASSVDVESAGKMAMELTGLAGDLSAFFNIDTETAFNKIRSGMAGMVRPLRDLGIDLTAATLQEYALSQGITKSYRSMTQAEKVMLRYRYLMSATTTQQNDFYKTSQSLANSMRTLRAYAAAVTTQIGVGFASAIRHVVVMLNALMKHLLSAATAFATFMQTIFGKYKGGASGMVTDLSSIAEDMDDAGDAASSGLGSAADSAKKIKKDLSVLPFDELNQLNKDADSSGSGNGSGDGGGSAIGIGLDDMFDLQDQIESSTLPDAISEWGRRIKKAFNLQDWQKLGNELAWGINQGIDKVYAIFNSGTIEEKVVPFIQKFSQTLNSLTSSIHWGDMGIALGTGVNTLFTILNEAIGNYNFSNLGANVAFFLNGAVDKIDFGSIGEFLGQKFMIIWDFLDSAVHKFRWDKLGLQFAEGIKSLNDYINLSTVAETLSGFINGIFTALKEFAENTPWDEIVDNIVGGITTFIRTTNWQANGEALGTFLRKLCEALVKIAKTTPWRELGEGIATMLSELPWGEILATLADVIVTALGGLLKGLCSKPEGAIAVAIIAGLEAISIAGKLGGFVNKVGRAVEGADWGGLSGIFKKIFTKGIEEGSEAAATAAKIGGSGTSSSIGAGAGSIGAVGGTLALGGGLIAAAGTSYAIGKGLDKLEGGNGILTETAAQLEGLGTQLRDIGAISNAENSKLYDYIEGMESAGASYSDTMKGVMGILSNTGLTTDQMRDALERLRAEGYISNQEFNTLNAAFSATQQYSQVAQQSYHDTGVAAQQMSSTTSQVATETKKNNDVTFGSVSELASYVQKQWNNTSTNVQKNSEKANTSVTKSLGSINQAYAEATKKILAENGTQMTSVSETLSRMQADQEKHTQKTKEQSEQQYKNQSDALSKTTSAYENTRITTSNLMAMLTNDIIAKTGNAATVFTNNFTNGFDQIAKSFQNTAKSIGNELDIVSSQMYQAGRELSLNLQKGLSSVSVSFPNIRLPHVGWWWNTFDFGGTWFNIPSFYVQWYKSGGLFMGGEGQIVGLAEGGKDEAVLPLENKKAMSRIANAIVDSNSGLGINSQQIADAVAVGVSTAMMNNSGNTNNQMLYVEVKTENDEVLARAVTRGQQKLGQRYNN